MALKTVEEQLESVQLSIAQIEGIDANGDADGKGAQSYGIAGRSLQRASLESLYKREKELKQTLFRQKKGTNYHYFIHK